MTVAAFVGVAGALLAGILLCAGTAKLAVPAHLSRVVGELVPAVSASAVPITRVIAAVEIATAVALSVPATRDAGAAAGAVLGVGFIAAGGIGAVRGLGSPCGCFGRAGGKPLGLTNVAYGLVVVALSVVLYVDTSGGWAAYDGLPMLGTATVAVLLAGWVYRDMIKDLGRGLVRARRGSATRSG